MLLHQRTQSQQTHHSRTHDPRTLAGTIALSVLNLHLSTQQTIAQVVPTQSTQVQTVGNQFTIKGGDLSSDGKNRFHTFTEFNLSATQIANFESNPKIQNIFSRISGDASLINGLLKVSGGNANLFLINPSGILFGKDARLSLPAAFTATTATDLKFGTQTWSIGAPTNYSALLGNPSQLILHPTGSIINSGNLAVNAGQSVSLIGSNVINTGTIATPGGQITLAAIPGSKAVKLTHSNNLLSLEFQPIDPATSLISSLKATSLPQLLAGSNIQNATGLALTPDGKVQLTGSGLTLSDTPGLAAIAGTLDAATTGGNIQVLGQDIKLTNPNLFAGTHTSNPDPNTPTGQITLNATDTIETTPNLTLNLAAEPSTQLKLTAGQKIAIGRVIAPGGIILEAPIVETLDINRYLEFPAGPVSITASTRLTTRDVFTDGNPLNLTGGTITTGILNSAPNYTPNPTPNPTNGGDITVTATGNITTQLIDADAKFKDINPTTGLPIFIGTPGTIRLSTIGLDSLIQTGGIRSRGSSPGSNSASNSGSNVLIEGDRLQIGTGDSFNLPTLTPLENQVSIDTTGGILLSQRGSSTLLPFVVGDAQALNGTSGSLVARGVRLNQGTFPVQNTPYRLNPATGITIESLSRRNDPTPVPPPIPVAPPTPITDPIAAAPVTIPTASPTAPQVIPAFPQPTNARSVVLTSPSETPSNLGNLDAEQRLTADFKSLGGAGPVRSRTTADAQSMTQEIESQTGVKAALIYFTFVPTQTQLMSEAIGQKADDTLEITLVTAKGIVRKLVTTADRTRILTTARAFRQEVTNPLRTHTTSYLRSSQQLYQWLISPLAAELKAQNISNLVFLPDTGLRSLPYGALHDGNDFLIQRYSISLMPSISLTDIGYRDLRHEKMLTIGISESTQGQSPLPSVTAEIDTIRQLWPHTSALKNQQATLENLKSARSQYPFPIVHLATHGNFSHSSTQGSYIQLWNEKLNLNQIRALGWSTPPVELLVLSACKTAIGDRETELGFAGLAFQTGVKSTIASLWNVNDTATSALMINLYTQLKTAPTKAEALRQSQRDLIRTAPFQHPYFWSAFTLIGNPW